MRAQVQQRHSQRLVAPERGGSTAIIRGDGFVVADFVQPSAGYSVRPPEMLGLELLSLSGSDTGNRVIHPVRATYLSATALEIELPANVADVYELRLVLNVSYSHVTRRITQIDHHVFRAQNGTVMVGSSEVVLPSVATEILAPVHYYPPPQPHKFTPNSGPTEGGSRAVLSGASFFNTSTFLLRFASSGGNVTINGTLLNASRGVCLSPPVPLTADQTPRRWSVSLSIDTADTRERLFVTVPFGFVFYKRETWTLATPRTVSHAQSGDIGTVLTLLGDGASFQTMDAFESAAVSARCRFPINGSSSLASTSPLFPHRFRFARRATIANPAGANATDHVFALRLEALRREGVLNGNCSDVRVLQPRASALRFIPAWVQPDCQRLWFRASLSPYENATVRYPPLTPRAFHVDRVLIKALWSHLCVGPGAVRRWAVARHCRDTPVLAWNDVTVVCRVQFRRRV